MAVSRGRLAIIVVIGLIVLAAIVTPIAYFASRSSRGDDSEDTTTERIDCFPEAVSPAVTLTEGDCQGRGCIFDSGAAARGRVACYYPKSGGLGYEVSGRTDQPDAFNVQLKRVGRSPFGQDFRRPSLQVHKLSNALLRFTFDDDYASTTRYRVPLSLNLPGTGANNPLYDVTVSSDTNLALKITRKATGKVIFDTGVGGLVLSDQFLQLTTRLPSRNVYGLGENVHDTFRHQLNLSWPAFARDQPAGGHLNHYGVHPFYTCLEDESGNTHGVFMLNSNAQEYAFTQDPTLTFRTVGGVLDFFVFLGPSPENVVQQYTGLIGRPVMPPYWALGFQLCRYGYDNLRNLQRAVNETLHYGIPLDVQYADIDHMEEQRIFTVDNKSFAGLNDYFQSLRHGGMHTIIILDPCMITNVTNYKPYEKMKAVKGNIVWPPDFKVPANSSDEDGSMLGYVWPVGKVVFPDYFKNATQQAWKELIVDHRKVLIFDGLWIDMNEPANFGTNEERPWNWPEYARPYWSLHCGNNTWDDPPYRPLAAYAYDSKEKRASLSDKTLCMNAAQGERGELRHYDVHSLYGWSQTPPTLTAAREATGERSIVISRSTFPGSGKYGGHWLGDNASIWKHLRDSIIGMLEFNLFGIPYIGADICGFFDNTTYELCHRWMQLGAFYPFCRNHNGKGYIEQHPGAFDSAFGKASREILETRYWLLPYLYTLFHLAHTEGSTVVRPLHHEFPTDPETYGIDRQFMWGPALVISPILEQGQTELSYYLPAGRWYSFYDGRVKSGPARHTVQVNLTSKPELHLRGGHVLVLQEPANNTEFSRKNGFYIRVLLSALDKDGGEGRGSLFWDDGKSVDTYEQGQYFMAVYRAANKTLEIAVIHNTVAEVNALIYNNVTVYGVSSVTEVRLGASTSLSYRFDPNLQVLEIALNRPISGNYNVTWK